MIKDGYVSGFKGNLNAINYEKLKYKKLSTTEREREKEKERIEAETERGITKKRWLPKLRYCDWKYI
jgi:hypothetical protein